MLSRWSISRFFRLIPIWLRVVLVGGIISAVIFQDVLSPSVNGSIAGYNHTDRPIFRFWVNDNYGGNITAQSWGGTTCCWSFKGDTVEIVWILSMTGEQERAGVESERHSMVLPMPAYARGDQYLHVHFLPENEVDLIWSPSIRSPKFNLYSRSSRNEGAIFPEEIQFQQG
ncbi:DUF3304 domain-containing protein [Halomonas sp. DQ26W]|uniref:DUF3304 domain-containing protein n=1 Tax=Halomonas sp. DQ26W TaxID=2282311 RepID=UPI000DF7D793|nr:DUF3304 domain-containing protein [Halomonas sp. DQ26W]